jgi:hypothetical protein
MWIIAAKAVYGRRDLLKTEPSVAVAQQLLLQQLLLAGLDLG